MQRHRKLLASLMLIAVCSLAGLLDVTYRRHVYSTDGYRSTTVIGSGIREEQNLTSTLNNRSMVIDSGNTTVTTSISGDVTTMVAPQPSIVIPPSDNQVTMTANNFTGAEKLVLVLSYQRTGSSFIGGIFSDSQRTFYVYEPLDPLYAAMYGIPVGWTVPSDIFSNKDGSLRSIPEDELAAVTWTLEKIYACEMSSLPVAMLAHAFWNIFARQMTHASGYVACLRGHHVHIERALDTCQRHIKSRCGTRFGSKPFNQNTCKSYLWGNASAVEGAEYTPRCQRYRHRITDPDLPVDFKNYYQCLINLAPVVSQCAAKHFDAPCRERSLRAIKTVRANMETATRILHNHENSYLIHLYRDPRGAVSSRLKATWSQGMWTKRSTANEAQLYCSQVLADVHHRYTLEQAGYKPRIKELIYDGYVQEPLLNLLDIYNFIGQEPSMDIKNKYIANRQLPASKNSLSVANKWTKGLRPSQQRAIVENCVQFFNDTTFQWS